MERMVFSQKGHIESQFRPFRQGCDRDKSKNRKMAQLQNALCSSTKFYCTTRLQAIQYHVQRPLWDIHVPFALNRSWGHWYQFSGTKYMRNGVLMYWFSKLVNIGFLILPSFHLQLEIRPLSCEILTADTLYTSRSSLEVPHEPNMQRVRCFLKELQFFQKISVQIRRVTSVSLASLRFWKTICGQFQPSLTCPTFPRTKNVESTEFNTRIPSSLSVTISSSLHTSQLASPASRPPSSGT